MTSNFKSSNVMIPAGHVWLDGVLNYSPGSAGLILIIERNGNNLITGRSAFLATLLNEQGFSTLTASMLSHDEQKRTPGLWNQIPVLSGRLTAVATWIADQAQLLTLSLGVLARDTSAAAMIRIAAQGNHAFAALACRGGRPDLAGLQPIDSLRLPLMLVVGELDNETSLQNQQVYGRLHCPKRLSAIPKASHTFEEIGTLELLGQELAFWYKLWLVNGGVEPLPNP